MHTKIFKITVQVTNISKCKPHIVKLKLTTDVHALNNKSPNMSVFICCHSLIPPYFLRIVPSQPWNSQEVQSKCVHEMGKRLWAL
jgi:hypothetical protein